MKPLLTVATLALVVLQGSSAAVTRADEVTKAMLVGSWENASEDIPAEAQMIKHVTPTHFTWIIVHRADRKPLGMAGGTWTLQDGVYTEKVEYATDEHEHLRGKEFSFSAKLDGGKWLHKSRPDSGLEVDEVWRRIK